MTTSTSTPRKALTSLKARTRRSPSLPSPSYHRRRGAGAVGDSMARLTLFQRRSPRKRSFRWRSGPMCSTRAGRKHGEPLTRPLPTVVPCSDRDTPGPPPTPVIGTAPDLCLPKPDGDPPRICLSVTACREEPVVIKQAPVKRSQRRQGQLRPAPRRDPRQDLGGRRLQRLEPPRPPATALDGGATLSSSPVPAVVTVGPRRLVGWAASCRGPGSWRRTRCRAPAGRSWKTHRASRGGRPLR
jgi:hypothetical protein